MNVDIEDILDSEEGYDSVREFLFSIAVAGGGELSVVDLYAKLDIYVNEKGIL